MWARQYLVILLFQALLAITIIISTLSLAFARNATQARWSRSSLIAASRAGVLAADPRDGAPAGAARVSLLEALAVLAAGFAAGGVNTIVGSGSLITFPTLLAVGYSSVVANVSNSRRAGARAGSAARSATAASCRGQWRRVVILAIGTTVGALRRRHPAARAARERCSTPSSRS